tara:strand:- start:122 stop:331 length:210 start_codon:yes stop_codon:yes gene_type:complete
MTEQLGETLVFQLTFENFTELLLNLYEHLQDYILIEYSSRLLHIRKELYEVVLDFDVGMIEQEPLLQWI